MTTRSTDRFKHPSSLDFACVLKRPPATDSNHRLFLTPTEYQNDLFQVAKDYNAQHAGEFISIPAIER